MPWQLPGYRVLGSYTSLSVLDLTAQGEEAVRRGVGPHRSDEAVCAKGPQGDLRRRGAQTHELHYTIKRRNGPIVSVSIKENLLLEDVLVHQHQQGTLCLCSHAHAGAWQWQQH